MADFTDWLARTFFITEEQEQTAEQVREAQQAILDRQREEGKVDLREYLELSGEIVDTGTAYFDRELGKPGVAGLAMTIPWWVWALVAGGLFIWLGGLNLIKGRK